MWVLADAASFQKTGGLVSDHPEPLRGVVALENQQRLLLPPAVPVSPQACPAYFCHLVPDGARRLQPVDVERSVIERGRGSSDAVSVMLIEMLEKSCDRKARDPGAPNVADWEACQATHLPCEVVGTILFIGRCQQRSVKFQRLAWTAASTRLQSTTRSQCFSRKTAIRVQ